MTIDEHRHIGVCGGRATRRTDDIIRELDRLEVDFAVVAASGVAREAQPPSREQEYRETMETFESVDQYFKSGRVTPMIENLQSSGIDHEELLDAVRSTSGRLLGSWWVNPWTVEESAAQISKTVRTHALRYFKVHPSCQAFSAGDEKVLRNTMELAAQLDLPLWFHTSSGPGSDFHSIVKTAKSFPHVQVILGHVAGGDATGTGDAQGAAEATAENANVWFDLSHCRLEALRRVLQVADTDKLLMASDDPWGGDLTLEEVMGNIRKVTESNESLRRKLMGGNAARLLRVERS